MLLRVEAFGATAELTCPAALGPEIRAVLASSGRVEELAGIDDRGSRAVPDASFEITTSGPPELVRRVLSELHLAIAVHARDVLFVHAGAVEWRGIGIVVPARSMNGKTTLVAELVAQGATYLSDEYAVLDGIGRVHPYAKPMCVRGDDGANRFVAVADPGKVPVRVGVIVSTAHVPGAIWDPVTVMGAAAVLPLVDNTVVARLAPERMLDVCSVVASRAVCWSGPRPDALVAAPEILTMVDALVDQGLVG